jgi:hypothetical protein
MLVQLAVLMAGCGAGLWNIRNTAHYDMASDILRLYAHTFLGMKPKRISVRTHMQTDEWELVVLDAEHHGLRCILEMIPAMRWLPTIKGSSLSCVATVLQTCRRTIGHVI